MTDSDKNPIDPLANIELRYHGAMEKFARLLGLDIRPVPKCEGGGFMIRRDQAERIAQLAIDSRRPRIATSLFDCPFCGTTPERQRDAEDWSWVECPSCGARTGYRSDASDADAAWNRRDERT